MEVCFMFFKATSLFVTDLLYEKSMVNNLFEFDLDKIRSKKTSLIVLENTTIKNQSKTSSKKGQIKLIAPFISFLI